GPGRAPSTNSPASHWAEVVAAPECRGSAATAAGARRPAMPTPARTSAESLRGIPITRGPSRRAHGAGLAPGPTRGVCASSLGEAPRADHDCGWPCPRALGDPTRGRVCRTRLQVSAGFSPVFPLQRDIHLCVFYQQNALMLSQSLTHDYGRGRDEDVTTTSGEHRPPGNHRTRTPLTPPGRCRAAGPW